ncbi:MAG: NADH-quinone oxidoreductase subunit NuoE [Dehalococcoidales bacterium]|nr:NADH-quinone oxidoreductase subunit NuoE [Dehalococcoidales bacterium]
MGSQAQGVITQFASDRSNLIPILQKVQEAERFISEEAVAEISRHLSISENDIYSVASFYSQFRFHLPGDHTIKVCLGTACHVIGGERIAESVERELGIKPGQTTDDFRFSMERVACFGCCALAPVMVIDEDVYSRMTPVKVKEVLEKYK